MVVNDKILETKLENKIVNSYVNELTRELDKHLVCEHEFFISYIMEPMNRNHYPIRYPGATRGFIETDDDGVIIEIHFYDDTAFNLNSLGIYKPSAVEAVQKFIGYKIKIE